MTPAYFGSVGPVKRLLEVGEEIKGLGSPEIVRFDLVMLPWSKCLKSLENRL